MKILMAANEMAPFIEEPSANALSALSSALRKLGHEVSIVLPLYRSRLKNKKFDPKSTGVRFLVPLGNQRLPCEIFEIRLSDGMQTFFVGRDEYFNRTQLSKNQSYPDNSVRFIFYARCVVELARRISPLPDILHCHNWEAALIPAIIQASRLAFKTVLSVDTLEQQGNFWSHDFALTNLPKQYFSTTGLEFYGSLNFLKGGILFSDAVVLPSQRYVHEAQQPKHGCGLDSVLREHSKKLYGFFNGVDESIWNPAQDRSIRATYSASDPKGKSLCSAELLSLLQLVPSPEGPIFAIDSQLVEESGFDILLPILDRFLTEDTRLIVLGPSPSKYETILRFTARKHISKFSYRIDRHESLTHQVLAGADILLLPSDMDLNGTSVTKALKYGVIPIAHACSSLHQFIQDYDEANNTGLGFVFYDNSQEALLDSIWRALIIFGKKNLWKDMVARALSTDFSWQSSARCYERLYTSLLLSSQP